MKSIKTKKALYALTYRLRLKGLIIDHKERTISANEAKPETWWENLTKRTRRQVYNHKLLSGYSVGTFLSDSQDPNRPGMWVFGNLVVTDKEGVVMEVDVCDFDSEEVVDEQEELNEDIDVGDNVDWSTVSI